MSPGDSHIHSPFPLLLAVARTVKMLPAIDTMHGTLSFFTSTYQSLNPAVARRALGLWIRYIGGVSDIRYDLIAPMHKLLHSADKPSNITGSNILMTVDPKVKQSLIARRSPDSKYRVKVPIRIGESILWDNRFKISLVPRGGTGGPPADEPASNKSPVFYVRHLVEKDWHLMSKGASRYKAPVAVRGGLPVVVNDKNKIVLMPHFKVVNREAKIWAIVRFRPLRSVEDLLQYSHYHEC